MRAVQFRPATADVGASRRALVAMASQAARGASLVVLPEMACTRYLWPERAAVEQLAEPARGETFAALAPIARAAGCWLVAGFVERAADLLFNSALVIAPTGELAFCYRKTLLFSADVVWATPGDSGYAAFDTEFGRFGVGICMDLNDDRFVAWLRSSRVELVAFPTSWLLEGPPAELFAYWRWRLRRWRAVLVAADRWGAEGAIAFAGSSAVLDGAGRVVAALPPTGDGLVGARLHRREQ